MCRFVLYHGPEISLADLVTKPRNSLIHQSFHAERRREPLNGDGFGMAWYVPRVRAEPALFRSITPAWSNRNLLDLAAVIRSGAILAHVRAATPGSPVVETNCHPFRSGKLAFMHNGHVSDFKAPWCPPRNSWRSADLAWRMILPERFSFEAQGA